jgi:transposase
VRDAVRELVAAGRTDEALDFVLEAFAALQQSTQQLELLVAHLRRPGRRSERIDAGQLALLLEQLAALPPTGPGADPSADPVRDAAAESCEDARLDQEIESAGPQRSAPSARTVRMPWRTTGGRRERHDCRVQASDRACPTCGRAMRRIGADHTQRLEYIPGHFITHEYELEKLACGRCKNGVMTAESPLAILDRSGAGASTLAQIVVAKFADHLPLTRQHQIYARTGLTIPVSTLADWVAGTADQLAPLVERLAARVLQATVVGTDATGLRVLAPTQAAHIEQGTMWCYVGDARDVVFRYAPTGAGEQGPWAFLAGRVGYVQADAASVFDRVYTGAVASATEVGCWAHGRRRFVALQDTDCRVAYPIQLITRLYKIERLADVRALSVEGRRLLREERVPSVLEKLQRWLAATLATEPPRSDLAKAAGYLVNQWTALTRFVHDGRLSLDNNLVERQLRAIALGRLNYLFAGSHRAAERTAVLYSLMRTCAQYDVAPVPYLTDVLTRLARGDHADRLDDLLPDRWATLAPANASA